jgi:hypothetical protein
MLLPLVTACVLAYFAGALWTMTHVGADVEHKDRKPGEPPRRDEEVVKAILILVMSLAWPATVYFFRHQRRG